ncbi:hypothetical protein [Sphingomonas natans]|uniref:hypothetical protein n=1 Tax=Sphingomonas natans TaxID=3063330 RepID=UPI0026E40F30|nr:hypothetical protein [Sphingomonas sp. BIUV-7]
MPLVISPTDKLVASRCFGNSNRARPDAPVDLLKTVYENFFDVIEWPPQRVTKRTDGDDRAGAYKAPICNVGFHVKFG